MLNVRTMTQRSARAFAPSGFVARAQIGRLVAKRESYERRARALTVFTGQNRRSHGGWSMLRGAIVGYGFIAKLRPNRRSGHRREHVSRGTGEGLECVELIGTASENARQRRELRLQGE